MIHSLSQLRLALSQLSWLKKNAHHLAKTVECALRSSVCVQVHLAVPFVNPVSRSSFLSKFSLINFMVANNLFFSRPIELVLDNRTSYLSVALFTFISFLSGLCCIGCLQFSVERAFSEKDNDRSTYSSGVSSKLQFSDEIS